MVFSEIVISTCAIFSTCGRHVFASQKISTNFGTSTPSSPVSASITNARSQPRKSKSIVHDMSAQVQSRTTMPPSRAARASRSFATCWLASTVLRLCRRERCQDAPDLRVRRDCARHCEFHMDLALPRGLAKQAFSRMRLRKAAARHVRIATCVLSRKLLETVGNRPGNRRQNIGNRCIGLMKVN